jgi:hypothetical protein
MWRIEIDQKSFEDLLVGWFRFCTARQFFFLSFSKGRFHIDILLCRAFLLENEAEILETFTLA